jgi:diguanylate cyclase (GGDEF)-like protein
VKDPLTRLATRPLLYEHARLATRRARRNDRKVALIHFGLDDFRLVNDSLGRLAGDNVLREAGRRLRTALPDVMVLGRSGGDEFCALMTDLDQDAEPVVEAVAAQIRAVLSEPFEVDGRTFELGATMGASCFPTDAPDEDALLRHADTAMHQAKETERGGLLFYSGGTADALERLMMTGRLRDALEHEEFVLEYQPIVGVPDREVRALEALLRWDDPVQGRIEPMRFIPAAEHTGLIEPIGEWVIEAACEQGRAWGDDGFDVSVSVNVSLRQFRSDRFVDSVAGALHGAGFDATRLLVEVTESTAMRERHCVEPILAQLRDLGVRVAIDDFGVGYSSLGRLRELEVDMLKIDRSFLPANGGDERADRLLWATLELVDALGMTAVVEGVETAEQYERLVDRDIPCLAQGFHLARPLPAHRVADMLRVA